MPALVAALVVLAIGAIVVLTPMLRPVEVEVDTTLPPLPPGIRPPVPEPIAVPPVPDVVIPVPRNLLLIPGLF